MAAQYLKRVPCITTVYVSSSESRALIRLSERGISKAVLIRITDREMEQIAEENNLADRTFTKNYVIAREKGYGVCIFQSIYAYTNQARPPDDGKLREIKPDLNWLSVSGEYLLPKPHIRKYPPLPLNFIYI